MGFLIQTIDGQVRHDFCFHTVEAIEYWNFSHGDKLYQKNFFRTH